MPAASTSLFNTSTPSGTTVTHVASFIGGQFQTVATYNSGTTGTGPLIQQVVGSQFQIPLGATITGVVLTLTETGSVQ